MENFTPWPSLVGGLLIGIAASALLLLNGRIAGISGILGRALAPRSGDTRWRLAFLGGLLAGGVLLSWTMPSVYPDAMPRGTPFLIAGGLLVGFGTRLGNGCTSGHGVCGNSRLSTRSMLATATFIAFGAATVLAVRVLGGSA